MGKKTKSGKGNKSSKPRNYIDKRYFGQLPDLSYETLNPKNGYVFYERSPKETSFWYTLWKSGTKELNSLISTAQVTDNDYSKVGFQLVALGNAELRKEVGIIQNILKTDIDIYEILGNKDEFKRFLVLINELLIGKEQFSAAVKRVKNALKQADEKWTPAPGINSLFLEQFTTDFYNELARIIRENVPSHQAEFYNGNFSSIESEVQNAYKQQFRKTFENIINKSSNFGKDSVFGEQEDYEEFLQYLNELKDQKEKMDEIFDRLYQKIPLDQIMSVIKNHSKDIVGNLKNKKATTLGISSFMKAEAKFQKSKTTGGTVAEIIQNILSNIHIDKDIMTGKSSFYSFNPQSEVMKIDQGIIISQSVEDIDKLIATSFKEMNQKHFASLNEAAEKISKFTTDVLDKIGKKDFIVYSNQKMYGLGSDYYEENGKGGMKKTRSGFNGFSGGNSRKITALREIADIAGGRKEIDNLIIMAKNAMKGAYLFGHQAQITEAISLHLAHFFAYLLFDDWVSFAHENTIGNVIHVFNLEGINVPLSYLLINMGRALTAAGHNIEYYTRASISYGSGAIFADGKYELEASEDGEEAHTTAEIIRAAWNKQRDVAEAETTFQIHFMNGFKDMFSKFF